MTPGPDDNCEYVRFTDADNFLSAIAPIPRLWTDTPSPEFIFRGQADASKPLIPSALRRDDTTGRTMALSLLDSHMLNGHADEQVWVEFHILKMFVDSCDRAVIPLPGDGYDFRKEWMDDQTGQVQRAYREPSLWPFPAHLPVLAFAQHYGIPTRLLDWTRNATVAAYSAASGVKGPGDSGESVVWALNTEFIHQCPRVELVPMPGANSARLGAQRGLFTVVRESATRGQAADDGLLPAALSSKNEDIAKPKPLWKLTLPQSEAGRLLYLCHLNGVDAALVYPGPEGAARAAMERGIWSRNDPKNSVQRGLRALTSPGSQY